MDKGLAHGAQAVTCEERAHGPVKGDLGGRRGGRGPLAKGAKARGAEFTSDFRLDGCTFATTGRNACFILEPGYQLSLEHREGDDSEQLVVTVLDETEKAGGVETRVVEERETENGDLTDVSRNYVAFCIEDGGVYYFGERTTKYTNGQPGIANDSWRADAARSDTGAHCAASPTGVLP